MQFCYFVIISPVKRAGPFIWTYINPNHLLMFVPSLVKIGQMVLEKRFFLISSMYFCYLYIISPCKRGEGAFIWINLISFTLCQILLKLAQWFWRNRRKCEKFTDRWTHDGQQVIWAFSSGGLKKEGYVHYTLNKLRSKSRKYSIAILHFIKAKCHDIFSIKLQINYWFIVIIKVFSNYIKFMTLFLFHI